MTLSIVDCWIFDLDNTLYDPSANLFGQIDVQMMRFIEDRLGVDPVEAKRIQKRYFHDHGTTLAGLMHHHGTDPTEFLDFVHNIDLSVIRPDPLVRAGLAKLPGRRLVFTNGDAAYAGRVLAALDIADLFDGVQDIVACGYVPKPQQPAYDRLIADQAVDPARALFVEDMAQNLRPAKAMGMQTVWINNGSERGDHGVDHAWIDQEISHIGQWLTQMTETMA